MLRSKALLAGLLACGMVSAEGVKVRTSIIAHTLSQAASYGVIWDTPRSVWMPKCAIPPKLDGSLHDACWHDATQWLLTPRWGTPQYCSLKPSPTDAGSDPYPRLPD